MVQSGGMTLVKYLLFIFNFVFVACGVAIIVVGAITINTVKEYELQLGNAFVAAPVVIIVVGAVIFLIAFLGCCGAVQESQCMLMTFGVLIGLVFIIELAAGIAVIVYKKEINDYVDKSLRASFKSEQIDKVWKNMQLKLKCCGLNSSKDYINEIPPSCCGKDDKTSMCSKQEAYKQGCFAAVKDIVLSNQNIAGGVALGLAFVEILGIVFACCLAKAIKQEYGVA